MRKLGTSAAVLAVALGFAQAQSAQAQSTSKEALRVVEVLRDNGCRVNDIDADEIFGKQGMQRKDVEPVLMDLVARGDVVFDDGGFGLTPSVCSGAAPQKPAEIRIKTVAQAEKYVLALMAANGCSMKHTTYLKALDQSGFVILGMNKGVPPTKEQMAQIQQRSLLETAPAVLLDRGLFVSDTKDPQVVHSIGKGCK